MTQEVAFRDLPAPIGKFLPSMSGFKPGEVMVHRVCEGFCPSSKRQPEFRFFNENIKKHTEGCNAWAAARDSSRGIFKISQKFIAKILEGD